MMDFGNKLKNLLRKYHIRIVKPVPDDIIINTFRTLKLTCDDLYMLYQITNGINYNWLNLFSIEDKMNVKKTWNSIQRANNISISKYLGNDESLFKRFVIFADISGGNCAAIDREDLSIWYEEDELNQTDLDLLGFIELSLKEAEELS